MGLGGQPSLWCNLSGDRMEYLLAAAVIGLAMWAAYNLRRQPVRACPWVLLEFEHALPETMEGAALREELRRSKVVAMNYELESLLHLKKGQLLGAILRTVDGPDIEALLVAGVPDGPLTVGAEDGKEVATDAFKVRWKYHSNRTNVIYYVQPVAKAMPAMRLARR